MPAFRLKVGKHADWSPDGTDSNHVYSAGERVVSVQDLAAHDPQKFSLIEGTEDLYPPGQEPTEEDKRRKAQAAFNKDAMRGKRPSPAKENPDRAKGRETLEGMTIHDLQEMAQAEEIDLKGATRKADIIEAIVSAG